MQFLEKRKELLTKAAKDFISKAIQADGVTIPFGHLYSFDLYFAEIAKLYGEIKVAKEKEAKHAELLKNHPPERELIKANAAGRVICSLLKLDSVQAALDSNGNNLALIKKEIDVVSNFVSSKAFIKIQEKTFRDAVGTSARLKGLSLAQVRTSGCISQKAYDLLIIEVTKNAKGEGEKVVNYARQLIDQSPISEKEAMAEVNKIKIDQSAVNGLKSSEYQGGKAGIERLKKDIADLYRLTNGKISVERLVKVPRNPRAHFSNQSEFDGDQAINVGSCLSKPVLWHELAHSIEYNNPEILQATRGFLMERLSKAEAAGSGIKPLRQIYNNNSYRYDEIAIEDSAYSHYVTKIYKTNKAQAFSADNIRSSEVISMGIQALVDVNNATKILAKDPDYFVFILGLIHNMRSEND